MAAALENDFFHSYIFKEKQPVLVVFFATWCPKCNMMLPLVDEIENDFAKDLKVVRIDTEKYEKLTKECGIEIVPTFLLFPRRSARYDERDSFQTSLKKTYSGDALLYPFLTY